MAIHDDVPVAETDEILASEGAQLFASGIAHTKAAVADVQLRRAELEVLAAGAVVSVLRRAVQDRAEILQAALVVLHHADHLREIMPVNTTNTKYKRILRGVTLNSVQYGHRTLGV